MHLFHEFLDLMQGLVLFFVVADDGVPMLFPFLRHRVWSRMGW
jgi:hypothetical protein